MSWIVNRPRFILFGDSLTERSFGMGGWGSSLAHHYYRKVDVINRGFGGYNTNWAMYLTDDIFRDCDDKNTALVTLFFGANDAARPLPDGNAHSTRQHVSLEEYKVNLKKIVGVVRDRGVQHILLITPPPVYEPARKDAYRMRMEQMGQPVDPDANLDRTNDYTKQYAVACQEVAKELGLPVVDLWSSMQVGQDWGTKLFNDGLHFTVEGNQMVFEAVQAAVNASFPAIRVEAMPIQYPAWDAFNAGPQSEAFMKPPKQ